VAAFDIDGLDEVIHGRLRLGIMAYLARTEPASFNALKSALHATQGNLSAHLRKLEDAGHVAIEKGYAGRKPMTTVRLTQSGRQAFAHYLNALVGLIGPGGE
jgi:DNA-binding MarR family transcriptional regulator